MFLKVFIPESVKGRIGVGSGGFFVLFFDFGARDTT